MMNLPLQTGFEGEIIDDAGNLIVTAATNDYWLTDFTAEVNHQHIAQIIRAVNNHTALVEALENVTALARIKYGNLDSDVDAYLTATERLVAAAKGEADASN